MAQPITSSPLGKSLSGRIVTKENMAKKLSPAALLAADRQYAEFLKKRLESKNYKANVSPEEYAKEQAKYDKVKLRLKLLDPNYKGKKK